MKNIAVFLYLTIFVISCVPNSLSSDSIKTKSLQIHDIQGCDQISPLNGQTVENITGIVTWKVDNGFYMQGESEDDNECSSEGIYVFTGNYPTVLPGDKVEVSGKVDEFTPGDETDNNLSITEIDSKSIKVISTENVLPKPLLISGDGEYSAPDKVIEDDALQNFDPTEDGIDYWESLEGMRVEVENARVVGPRNSYGEIFVISQDSIDRNIVSSQGALLMTEVDNNPERLLVSLPDAFKILVNLGDRFTTPLIGIIGYEYGNYRLIETNLPQVEKAVDIKETTLLVLTNNAIRFASYNVENLNRFDDARMKKVARQIARSMSAPDILVLEEVQDDSGIEDDGTTSAAKNLQVLIQLIQDSGGPKYSFIDPKLSNNSSGGVIGGNIRTVILYRSDRGIKLVNSDISWINTNNTAFNNSRQPMICEFEFKGQPFFVIGVHLVSNNLNTPLYGVVQPIEKPEEEKRITQAKWIAQILHKIIDNEGEVPFFIAGDFNDVPWSKTLTTIEDAGMFNLSKKITENERYSILYEGNAILFDQILINTNSLSEVQAVTVLHLNTNIAEKSQVSDHDPFLIDFQFK